MDVLISSERLQSRIDELAADINRDYTGLRPVLICVLKGAVFFMADVARRLEIDLEMDFMAVSSYGSSTDSSGVVRILKDLDMDIEGRHVLIVEDVIDSGLTLKYLTKNLNSRHPASLDIVTLLDKPGRRKALLPCRYVGFEIGDEFVVGYGLDLAEKYRNLPYHRRHTLAGRGEPTPRVLVFRTLGHRHMEPSLSKLLRSIAFPLLVVVILLALVQGLYRSPADNAMTFPQFQKLVEQKKVEAVVVKTRDLVVEGKVNGTGERFQIGFTDRFDMIALPLRERDRLSHRRAEAIGVAVAVEHVLAYHPDGRLLPLHHEPDAGGRHRRS